jgi:porphobilinogen deaminase
MRLDDKDLRVIVDSLGDDDAERIASAERTFLRSTGGNCRDIVAAYARIVDGEIQMEKFHAKPR